MRLCWLLLIPLMLSGCDWIGRQADALGEHMPVIGERCEHWQCITPSGQAESDAIKAEQARQQPSQPQPLSQMTPIYPSDQAAPPPAAASPARKQFPLNQPSASASGTPPL